jgi:hypothetical protein
VGKGTGLAEPSLWIRQQSGWHVKIYSEVGQDGRVKKRDKSSTVSVER